MKLKSRKEREEEEEEEDDDDDHHHHHHHDLQSCQQQLTPMVERFVQKNGIILSFFVFMLGETKDASMFFGEITRTFTIQVFEKTCADTMLFLHALSIHAYSTISHFSFYFTQTNWLPFVGRILASMLQDSE